MRKILMLTIALTLAAASQLPAAPALECSCSWCEGQPNTPCNIHTNFHTYCGQYYLNFCTE